MIGQLRALLGDVLNQSGPTFTGVGLIVTDQAGDLPVIHLRPNAPPVEAGSALNLLIAVSDESSPFHDGFHILSPSFQAISLSQYFSPPILPGVFIDGSRPVGGRYMAALFGSGLPNVLATGVATRRYGVAVFRDGHEIRSDQMQDE